MKVKLLMILLMVVTSAVVNARTIKETCMGTKEKGDRMMIAEMIFNKDFAALQEYIDEGKGILLNVGTEVTVVKHADFFTMLQVRPTGSSKLWWVRTIWMDDAIESE